MLPSQTTCSQIGASSTDEAAARHPHDRLGPLWEIAIKMAIGKLRLGLSTAELIQGAAERMKFRHLPITAENAIEASSLPLHHKDPFDRMLVAQARAEGLIILTADETLFKYDVPILDARK